MTHKLNRVDWAVKWAIKDGKIPFVCGSKNNKARTKGRGPDDNRRVSGAGLECTANTRLREWMGWVDKGVGKVLKVFDGNIGHENVGVVTAVPGRGRREHRWDCIRISGLVP